MNIAKTDRLKTVFYNDLNQGVCNLLDVLLSKSNNINLYEWISRDEFQKCKNGNCARSGFIKTCWSFGNNQRDYLYSKEIEQDKRLLHNAIVYRCEKSLNELNLKFSTNVNMSNIGSLYDESINERRLRFNRSFGQSRRATHLERVQNLLNINQLFKINDDYSKIKISNQSYDKVIINTPIKETIIYCDPPYKSTAKYQKDLDHTEFERWVKENKYKVYVSGYESDLRCVLELKHTSSMSAKSVKSTIERLFVNSK